MEQIARTYHRCNNCKTKPATLKCLQCADSKVFCFQCDRSFHNDNEAYHKRMVIKYDKVQQFNLENKENKQQNDDSVIIDESRIQNSIVDKLKTQEYENRLTIMQQHTNKIEQNYQENIKKMREEKMELEKQLYAEQQKNENLIGEMKVEMEKSVYNYRLQVETEQEKNKNLEEQLNSQERKQEERMRNMRKELQQVKLELEQQKEEQVQKEQDFEYQVVKYHTEQTQNTENMTNQLNKEYKMKQNQLYSQLNQKDKIINGLELQVQRIQECLKESEEWGKNLELNKNKEIEKYQEIIRELQDKEEQGNRELILHQQTLKLQATDIVKMEKEIKYLKDVSMKQVRKIEKYEKLVYGNNKK